jgi:hypothetical protein
MTGNQIGKLKRIIYFIQNFFGSKLKPKAVHVLLCPVDIGRVAAGHNIFLVNHKDASE